ncbi:MAG: V-type ATP synthase subunit D [Spirochaetales bacterium]|nr:V-type ATP synthase subunit D [Spirochaetales bacterium]
MAKLNIPPTKSNLIQMKEQKAVALQGFELLEQKRDILVMELMRMVERVKLLEADMDKTMAKAYASLKKMLLALGRETAREVSAGIKYDFSVVEKTVRIAGLPLPTLELKAPELNLQYSFMDTFAYTDETMRDFLAYLKDIADLASIRTMVWRLALEVKKTQRRVNALEKIVIPDSTETAIYIESILEEREREIFFIQKILKSKVEEGPE